ncbi:6372_t:CDS:2 [Paraglomus occultum]|uniref:6372_t:CDS:1 n=1 Tax=Paraglomus occultum TaxID=144539 RepID=A0A9N8W3K5_9GLOM|nr:6372_t:CDS:2 [Paraglomus occultum]
MAETSFVLGLTTSSALRKWYHTANPQTTETEVEDAYNKYKDFYAKYHSDHPAVITDCYAEYLATLDKQARNVAENIVAAAAAEGPGTVPVLVAQGFTEDARTYARINGVVLCDHEDVANQLVLSSVRHNAERRAREEELGRRQGESAALHQLSAEMMAGQRQLAEDMVAGFAAQRRAFARLERMVFVVLMVVVARWLL